MANFNLTREDKFPAGASVSVYDATGYDRWPGSAPGTAVQTLTMVAGGVTFTGLTAGGRYFASDGTNHLAFTANAGDAERDETAGGVWYCNANSGLDANSGDSWDQAFLTIDKALDSASDGDEIHITGKFREQLTPANTLGGIRIVGHSNRPRHSDSPWPTGAAWLPPASPASATALLTIRAQGWRVENILFDAPADAAAIELERNALSGDSEFDGSHFSAVGCRFDAGQSGIENDGGAGFCWIEDCMFRGLTNGIKTLNTAVAVPLQWVIRNNEFHDNTNHIDGPFSRSSIRGNTFGKFTTLCYDGTGGEYNSIWGNSISGDYDAGNVPGSNEEWGGNFNSLTGGVTAADPT